MEWRSKGFKYYRWSLLLCKEGFERGKDSNALVEVLRALCDLRFCNPEVPQNLRTQRLPRTAAEGAEIEKIGASTYFFLAGKNFFSIEATTT
jgi:hypothetical protein